MEGKEFNTHPVRPFFCIVKIHLLKSRWENANKQILRDDIFHFPWLKLFGRRVILRDTASLQRITFRAESTMNFHDSPLAASLILGFPK